MLTGDGHGFYPLAVRTDCYGEVHIVIFVPGKWPGKVNGPSLSRFGSGVGELRLLGRRGCHTFGLAYRAVAK